MQETSNPSAEVPPLASGRKIVRELHAAKQFGVDPSTMRRWRKEGTGPRPIKIGKRLYGYFSDELERWLNDPEGLR